jgi:hypothetical protein
MLEPTLKRLAIIIQNFPLLLVERTPDNLFNDGLLKLFERYFTVCNMLDDSTKARNAWKSLLKTNQTNVLQEPTIFVNYMRTVLKSLMDRLKTMTPESDGVADAWEICLDAVE